MQSKLNRKVKFGIALFLIVLIFVGIGCSIHFSMQYPDVQKEIFPMGDFVEFGYNTFIEGDHRNGYSIRVNRARVITYEDYLENYNISKEQRFIIENAPTPLPDRIYEVCVTVKNTNNVDTGIDISELAIQSMTFSSGVNQTLFFHANPKVDSLGFALKENSEMDFVFLFDLNEKDFRKKNWEKLLNGEGYDLFLTISQLPVKKMIALN